LTEPLEQTYEGYPSRRYRAASTGKYRQGDICYGFVHQLRAPKDSPAADVEIESEKIPFLGQPRIEDIRVGERRLQLVVWPTWMMVVAQSCEIEHADPQDTRLLAAPIVFRSQWDGPQWDRIRSGRAAGFLMLPPPSVDERSACGGQIRAWPSGVEAAVALGSTTLASPRVAGAVAFGISLGMQHLLQAKLVDFWSVRGWKSFAQRDELVGKIIREISETAEVADGPHKLCKVTLDDGEDGDEIAAGVVLRR
jgi:hypothetical protein